MERRGVMREQVWNGILDTDRLHRYYSALGDKFRRRHLFVQAFILVSSSGAAASLLASLSSYVAAALFLIVAGATVCASLSDYSGKAAMAESIASQYADLRIEWDRLWYADITAEAIVTLQYRYNKIPSGVPLTEDDGLHQKAQEATYETVPQEFNA